MGAPRPRRRAARVAAAVCVAAAALLPACPRGPAQARPRPPAHAAALVPAPPCGSGRRLLAGWAAGALLGGAGSGHAAPEVPRMVQPCPIEANNCYSSAAQNTRSRVRPWRWPQGRGREEAIAELKEVVNGYPQTGQSGVDKGGWKVAQEVFNGDDDGYMRIEYMSSGKGRFAKQYNDGKPFIDDLELRVEGQFVQVRSSSRLGKSDFGVNARRLNYFAKELRERGWDARDVQPLE